MSGKSKLFLSVTNRKSQSFIITTIPINYNSISLFQSRFKNALQISRELTFWEMQGRQIKDFYCHQKDVQMPLTKQKIF